MSTAKAVPRSGFDWVGYNLKITQHRLRQRLDAELARLGITAPQNAVLLAVAGSPRISNAELARAAFVTPQTMQAILVNLERGGLIVRSPHPGLGGVIMTELTKAAKRPLPRARKRLMWWSDKCSPCCQQKKPGFFVSCSSAALPPWTTSRLTASAAAGSLTVRRSRSAFSRTTRDRESAVGS